MTTGKTIALTRQTFVDMVMSLLNMLSRLVITFLPRSKYLLISWLNNQSIITYLEQFTIPGIPWGSDHKESACSAGDPDSVPGLGRSSGEGNGNPLQYACLENPMDRGAWWDTKSMGLQRLRHN